MANGGVILDFDLIDAHVQKLHEEFDFSEPKESKEFLALILRYGYGLDDFEIQNTIIDGSNDCGIDGVYIEEGDDGPIVHIFQSKYYRSRDKFDRNLEASALDKMENSIANFILRPNFDQPYQNARLTSKLQDIHALRNQKYKIIFCSNSNPPSASASAKFQEYIDRVNHGQDYFSVDYLDLLSIARILAPEKRQEITSEIELSGRFIDWPVGNMRTVVGRVRVEEIAKLRSEQGDLLFDKNVRGYLSQKNPVNQEIFKTVSDPEQSPLFFFLNNGITIICKKLSYTPREESPVIKLEDFQVVNGGQTTNAIYDAKVQNKLGDGAYVLIRIVQTDEDQLLDKITASTNNQTIVRARDLKSNDPIQRKIESWFLAKGLYYEARKNKYLGKQPANLRIDAEKAAQTYFAYNESRPADAKSKKKLLFGTFYTDIFNDSLDFDTFRFSYLLYKKIFALNKVYKDSFGFVNDGDLHILAMMKKAGICEESHMKSDSFEQTYLKILESIKIVVEEERERKGDVYSHRAFFINPDTIGRIGEVYIEGRVK